MKPTLSHSLEDYLECIFTLAQSGGGRTRVKEIAQAMKVRLPSVVGALRALKARNLVIQERYGDVRLTAEGQRFATEVDRRHHILMAVFTEVLKLPAAEAEHDACAIEHYLSPTAIERFEDLVKSQRGTPHEIVEQR